MLPAYRADSPRTPAGGLNVDSGTECHYTSIIGPRAMTTYKGEYMRILFLSFLLASAAILAVAQDKAAFAGKWEVRQSIAGNDNTQTCTFTQTGNDLTGTCGMEDKQLQISGKVDDKKVTWSFKTEYNGSPLTVKYAGAMDAQNKISGTVMVEEFNVEGEFSATQAK
jgi:hypothetical protein